MSRSQRIATAAERLGRLPQGETFCSTLVAALPVDGAAVSTLVSPFDPENICASDPASARLDQQQLDLGQGPCWQALSGRRPVTDPDVGMPSTSWPLFQRAAQAEDVGAIHAFPLRVGGLDIGAVDLYSQATGPMTAEDVADAVLLTRIVAGQVLNQALDRLVAADSESDERWMTRRVVHQATGMVIAQFGVKPDEALLILRAHAFALGRPVLDVATDVVARTIKIPS